MLNTDYTRETMDEFLHGHKSAPRADAARNDQLRWPVPPSQDNKSIWPSQVFFYPSLAVVEDIYNNVKSRQEIFKKPNENYVNSFNQSDHTIFDSKNYKISPTFGIDRSFSQLKDYTKDTTDVNKNFVLTIQGPNGYETINTAATYNALKALSLSCAEDGERIARIHCYRPFFKKIDALCDRLKQDLIYRDSVVRHVKTQGIAWAIKDLVFVCTRIISAWNLTKGYIYDYSEGLNKVRSTLTPDFVSIFVAWQEATFGFLKNLMISFLRLDIVIHTSNKPQERLGFLKNLEITMQNLMNRFCSESSKFGISSKATHSALMELSMSCCEYGEKVTNTYISRPFFRKVDTLCNRMKFELINGDGAVSNLNSQGTVWAIKELIFASTRIINAWNIIQEYVYNSSECLEKVRMDLSINFVPSFIEWQETSKKFVENLRISFLRLDNLAHTENNNFENESISEPMKVFKNNLEQLKSAEVFFNTVFCRNYFPDFIDTTPDFKDVSSIIKKYQNGGYGHVAEIVHDRNMEPTLDRNVNSFEEDVNKILTEDSLKHFQFDHIEGRPNEILFLYNYNYYS